MQCRKFKEAAVWGYSRKTAKRKRLQKGGKKKGGQRKRKTQKGGKKKGGRRRKQTGGWRNEVDSVLSWMESG